MRSVDETPRSRPWQHTIGLQHADNGGGGEIGFCLVIQVTHVRIQGWREVNPTYEQIVTHLMRFLTRGAR